MFQVKLLAFTTGFLLRKLTVLALGAFAKMKPSWKIALGGVLGNQTTGWAINILVHYITNQEQQSWRLLTKLMSLPFLFCARFVTSLFFCEFYCTVVNF
jgi:hypothetical protein